MKGMGTSITFTEKEFGYKPRAFMNIVERALKDARFRILTAYIQNKSK